jgi:hypothetical protein
MITAVVLMVIIRWLANVWLLWLRPTAVAKITARS